MARHSRSPRVSVPNQERVLVRIGNIQEAGILCTLSATGGAMRLGRPYGVGTLADLTLNTTAGKVTAALEFLKTRVVGVRDAQAFRFVHMEPVDRLRLQRVLEQLRGQGFGERQTITERAISAAFKTRDKLGALIFRA